MRPDRTDGQLGGQVYAADSASSRQCPARAPWVSPGVPAEWEEAGAMLFGSDPDTLFLKGSTWAAAGTSLLLVLVLLLVGTLGFTWKLHQERKQEWQTKEKLQRELSKSCAPSVPGTVRAAVSANDLVRLLCSTSGWKKSQKVKDWRTAWPYAAAVTLDPDSAYFELCVSEDGRSVRRALQGRSSPKAPGRFHHDPCVLGQELFSSGRHYWEVEVGDRTFWGLGVCEESSGKVWGIRESPQSGFWVLEQCANKHRALTCPPTLIPLSSPPTRVGVFLDYEAGDVSFYNVAGGSHIYTFPQAAFSRPLRPYFSLWFYHPCPLTLCH